MSDDIIIDIVESDSVDISLATSDSANINLDTSDDINLTISNKDSVNVDLDTSDDIQISMNVVGGVVTTQSSLTVLGGNILDFYIIHDLDEDDLTTYVGLQTKEGDWLVKRVVDDGTGDLDITYANISNNDTYTTYNTAWTARASLVYEELSDLNFSTAGTIPLIPDYDFSIAKGDVSQIVGVGKFGGIYKISASSDPVDLWNGGGEYTGFPTGVAETLEIRSDEPNDTLTGTGARTVKISNLLDEDWNHMPDVTITLNGTTWVSLGTQTYNRCLRAQVLTAGSSGFNEGEITIRHTTTTDNIFAVMPREQNQTNIMCLSVPAGKTLYVNRALIQMGRLNGSAGSSQMAIQAREEGSVFQTKKSPEITTSQQYVFENSGYMVFQEKTDIRFRCMSTSDNKTSISGELQGRLVTN